MNMDTLVKQSLEAASKITGKGFDDKETQEIAFKLSCAAMAALVIKVMTPTQRAKELGCESLAHVARVTKQSEQTLINWFKNPKKKDLFDIVCKGVSAQ